MFAASEDDYNMRNKRSIRQRACNRKCCRQARHSKVLAPDAITKFQSDAFRYCPCAMLLYAPGRHSKVMRSCRPGAALHILNRRMLPSGIRPDT